MTFKFPAIDITDRDDGRIIYWDEGDSIHKYKDEEEGGGGGGGSLTYQHQRAAGSVNANSSTPATKTGGPEVTLTVPASGVVLVMWSSRIIVNSGTGTRLATMRIDMSGANSGTLDSLCSIRNSPASQTQDAAMQQLATGLTPGSTTFTALYACSTDNADFTERELIVIPLP